MLNRPKKDKSYSNTFNKYIMLKSVFHPVTVSGHGNIALLLLRLTAGILMLTHGMGKLNLLLGSEPIAFPDPLGVGATASLALTVFAEVFCSVLLILGLATRLSVIPLIITMLVAFFIIHSADPLSAKELPLFYLVIYVALGIAGAGQFSIDHLLYKKMNR